MSLEYYLICRKSYNKILSELENIINNIDEMSDYVFIEENIEEKNKIDLNKHFFYERKRIIEFQKVLCNNKIHSLCSHNFIEDTIDITPDKSINITYCSICEYTLNNA
jgi:cell fate (sporulation/competence/biofilm development) regulator YmcA (YheA/YmcA/DUF963 family)